MATATKKVRATTAAAPAADAPDTASLEFFTYCDNGGGHHWEIVDGDGESLAHSKCFASQQDAERAARQVHEGAASARFASHALEGRRAGSR